MKLFGWLRQMEFRYVSIFLITVAMYVVGVAWYAYLIRQYERSIDGGYVSGPHYLLRIGYTQTDLAARYLLGKLADSRELRTRVATITALSYVSDPRVVDAAIGVLDDPKSTVRLQQIATTAIRRNLESLEWSSGTAIRRLEELEQDESLPLSLRRTTYQNLERLEEKGIAERRTPPPADLEAWWAEVEARRDALRERQMKDRRDVIREYRSRTR